MSRAPADPLWLGVDLGTSALKAGAFDGDGRCWGRARLSYATRSAGLVAEQDAETWWQVLLAALGRLPASGRGDVGGLAVGGHAPSPVLVDGGGQPVAPVQTWRDGRARGQHQRILERLRSEPKAGRQRLGAQVAARVLWLKEERPETFARARRVLLSGDYLAARLTGREVATELRAEEAFEAAGLPLSLLPAEEVRAGEVVGELRGELARDLGLRPGLPVIAGGLDSFLAAVGSGLSEPGDACLNGGSSSVVALVAQPPAAGRFELGGLPVLSRPLPGSGSLVELSVQRLGGGRSLAQVLAASYSQASHKETSPCGPEAERLAALLLAGAGTDEEPARRWAEELRRLPPQQAVRRAVEGVLLARRQLLDEMAEGSQPVTSVRLVGGWAAVEEISQLQAEILGRPVEVPELPEAGALGAALLAAVAGGRHANLRQASRAMVRRGRIFRPRFKERARTTAG